MTKATVPGHLYEQLDQQYKELKGKYKRLCERNRELEFKLFKAEQELKGDH